MSDTPDPARPYMRHYFHNMVQQSQTTMMGMWLFMVQEILFFGGLFGCYTWYRITYPVAYAAGAGSMDVFWGGLNTVVLISSSVTIVFAVHSIRHGRKNKCFSWLALTMVLCFVFLGIKYIEYNSKFAKHLVPGTEVNPKGAFDWGYYQAKHHAMDEYELARTAEGNPMSFLERKLYKHEAHVPASGQYSAHWFNKNYPAPKGLQLYYSLYFAMSGMHAIHMIIGLGIGIWLMILVAKDTFNPEYYPHIEYFGLYWHFVDIVWIFLFPLLYLI